MTTQIQVEDGVMRVPVQGMTEAEVDGLREKGGLYRRNASIRQRFRQMRDEGVKQEEALDALALDHGRSVAAIEHILGYK